MENTLANRTEEEAIENSTLDQISVSVADALHSFKLQSKILVGFILHILYRGFRNELILNQ